jgi:hypothetical protein
MLFRACIFLSTLSFEPDLRLTRIESHAFRDSSLQSICLPRNVVHLSGPAFFGISSDSCSISIDPDNENLIWESKFS